MLPIGFPKARQSGIGGDMAAGVIGFNLAADGGAKGSFSGTIPGSGGWCWFRV